MLVEGVKRSVPVGGGRWYRIDGYVASLLYPSYKKPCLFVGWVKRSVPIKGWWAPGNDVMLQQLNILPGSHI